MWIVPHFRWSYRFMVWLGMGIRVVIFVAARSEVPRASKELCGSRSADMNDYNTVHAYTQVELTFCTGGDWTRDLPFLPALAVWQ